MADAISRDERYTIFELTYVNGVRKIVIGVRVRGSLRDPSRPVVEIARAITELRSASARFISKGTTRSFSLLRSHRLTGSMALCGSGERTEYGSGHDDIERAFTASSADPAATTGSPTLLNLSRIMRRAD